jgi:hypothetical protein
MEIKLIDEFKFLPCEIIHHIFSYTDTIVYRYGKCMNRISKNDKRYKIVMSIPKPIKIGLDRFLFRLVNKNNIGYFIEYIIDFHIKINITIFVNELDGFDKYSNIKSKESYIFNANCNWSQIINYSM